MNVFFISPGRTGTTTISVAFSCITGFTSLHESRVKFLGDERVNYPTNHFECDNRLVWFLPRLSKKYAESSILVIVNREKLKIASSYNQRWGGIGIMRAYSQGILMRHLNENNLEVCKDYVDNVYEQLDFAKEEWGKVIYLDLDNPKQGVIEILKEINKEEYTDEILESFDTVKSNKNNKTIKVRVRQLIQNITMLFQDLFRY